MAPKAKPHPLAAKAAAKAAQAKSAASSPRGGSPARSSGRSPARSASPAKGAAAKGAGKGPAVPDEPLPSYAEFFDGTWVKDGSDVTYDVQGAKKIVIFDDNKENKKYRFEATAPDACKMVINDKTHTGKMIGTNQIKWSTGSTWVKPGFDGTWIKDDGGGKVQTFDVQPGKNIVEFDNGAKHEFDVRSHTTCIMTINGKEHQGTLVNPQTLTWSNGSTWTKPNFGGRWQKDGGDATFFIQPGKDVVTFDDGERYEFDVLSANTCKMIIKGKEHRGELIRGNMIQWSNGSTWVKLDGDPFAVRGPTPAQVQALTRNLEALEPTSGRFYRDMIGARAEVEPHSFNSRYEQLAPRPAGYSPGAASPALPPPTGEPKRSVFGCPCCGRLFHVYIEGGQYFAVVGKGLETVRVRLQPGLMQ